MSLEEGKIFAGHRIDGVVGKGGMGIVYRATQLALDLTVALKVMAPELAEDDDFRKRFRRESRLAASLDDPHIVPVRHAGEEEGLLYVTMRLVNGPDLGQLLESEGPLGPARAIEIVEQIGSALDAAHEKGLIHRDVKPANILVEAGKSGPSASAYLTDFGLTRRSVGSSGLTRTGQWVGTLDYVSPEQIRGEKLDERADLYSLGCVLFQALTGHAPFEQESDVATMYAHLEQPLPPLSELAPGLPTGLDDVLARATAKDPAERFGSCAEFAAAARKTLRDAKPAEDRGLTESLQPPTPPPDETKASPSPPADETRAADALAGETKAADAPAGEANGAAQTAAETKVPVPAPGKPREKQPVPPAPGKQAPPRGAAVRRRRWIAAAVLAGAALIAAVVIFGAAGGLGGGDSISDDDGDSSGGEGASAYERQVEVSTAARHFVVFMEGRQFDQACDMLTERYSQELDSGDGSMDCLLGPIGTPQDWEDLDGDIEITGDSARITYEEFGRRRAEALRENLSSNTASVRAVVKYLDLEREDGDWLVDHMAAVVP